jgi:hypothetical protein
LTSGGRTITLEANACPYPYNVVRSRKVEVSEILALAEAEVNKAKITAALRPIAFEKAVDLIVASAGMPAGKAAPPYLGAAAARVGGGTPNATLLGLVATRLKIDLDTVKEVYHEQDGKFDIIVSPGVLERAKSTGMKQIALLVAAVRQAAELEEFTDADHVRHFADAFNKYDEGNFATDLKGMTEEFRIRRDGRKILLKLSRPGWDSAAALVRRLGGAEAS